MPVRNQSVWGTCRNQPLWDTDRAVPFINRAASAANLETTARLTPGSTLYTMRRAVADTAVNLRHTMPYVGYVRYHNPHTAFQTRITPTAKRMPESNDARSEISRRAVPRPSYSLPTLLGQRGGGIFCNLRCRQPRVLCCANE